jgi:ABC-type sugar transport system substrate-binding protein
MMIVEARPSDGEGRFLQQKKKLHFAMASGGSEFFEPIREGWEDKCRELGVECEYHMENATWWEEEYDGNKTYHPKPCTVQMKQFIDDGVDGIAAKCNFDHDGK